VPDLNDAKKNAALDKLVNDFATRVASMISGRPMPDKDDGPKE
jgi:hypothetical protein